MWSSAMFFRFSCYLIAKVKKSFFACFYQFIIVI